MIRIERHIYGTLARLAFFVLVMMLAGCQAPGFLQAELPDDGPAIAVSQGAALRFIDKLQAAGEQATQTQRVTLTVTQEEVTSFLSIGSQLSKQLEAMQVEHGTIGTAPGFARAGAGRRIGDLDSVASGRRGIAQPKPF